MKLESQLNQLQLQRIRVDSLIQLRNSEPFKIQIDEVSRLNRDKRVTLRDDNTVYLLIRYHLIGDLFKIEKFKAIVYSAEGPIIPNYGGGSDVFDVNSCQGSHIYRTDRPLNGNHFSSLRLSVITNPNVMPQNYSFHISTKK